MAITLDSLLLCEDSEKSYLLFFNDLRYITTNISIIIKKPILVNVEK